MPSYILIPLLTAAFFVAAALDAWVAVSRDSLLAAVLLAVLWLVLMVALAWYGHVELAAFTVGLITLLTSGIVAPLIAGTFDWPPSYARVFLVESVMLGLAIANGVIHRRWRIRNAPSQPEARM